jgi:hypothetical protein
MIKAPTKYIWVVQGDYGQGWEDLTAEESLPEAKQRKKEYVVNEGGFYRIVRRRDADA